MFSGPTTDFRVLRVSIVRTWEVMRFQNCIPGLERSWNLGKLVRSSLGDGKDIELRFLPTMFEVIIENYEISMRKFSVKQATWTLCSQFCAH